MEKRAAWLRLAGRCIGGVTVLAAAGMAYGPISDGLAPVKLLLTAAVMLLLWCCAVARLSGLRWRAAAGQSLRHFAEGAALGALLLVILLAVRVLQMTLQGLP